MWRPRIFVLPLVFLLSAGAALAQTRLIDTVAGGGPDNLPALDVALPFPSAVAASGSGFVYVGVACRVYRVDPDGVLHVAVGDGWCASAGDGLPGPEARLSSVSGLALDAAGNLFITDKLAHKVRRLDVSTGLMSTYAGTGTAGQAGAGGPAVTAQVNGPEGIALDGSGNLFIADRENNRILRVDAVTLVLTVVAGTGTPGYGGDGGLAILAQVNRPRGVSATASGSILIADTGNHRIREVTPDGLIATVAGTGVAGSGADGQPATYSALSSPAAVLAEGAGFLIADTGNNKVRRVDSGGHITTIAGTGPAGFSGDGGPATDALLNGPVGISSIAPPGDLLVADRNNHRIRRVDAATGFISTLAGNGENSWLGDGLPATAASLIGAFGVTADSEGNLFIADTNHQRIRRVDAATGVITTVAGNGLNGFAGDGGPATLARLQFPLDVAVDAAGNIYIGDTSNRRIRRVDAATGVITTYAGNGATGFGGDGGPAVSATLGAPRGLAFDVEGNLYFADGINQRIRRIDASTGIITTVAGDGTEGYHGDGGPATSTSLWFPDDVAFDAEGNFYIADQFNHRIRRVDGNGHISTVAGSGTGGFGGDGGPATQAKLSYPSGVAVDADGNIVIADRINRRIRIVDAGTGVIDTLVGGGSGEGLGDGGPAFDGTVRDAQDIDTAPDGKVLVADSDRIRAVFRVNLPPTAAVTGAGTIECTGADGQTVRLDASASTDPDSTPGTNDDIVLYEWYRSWDSPSPLLIGTGPSLDLFVQLDEPEPVVVTLRVVDSAGHQATDTVQVDVVDTTPPVMTCPADLVIECSSAVATPVAIPPVEASDPCDGAVTVTRSEDPPNVPAGSGNFVIGTTRVTYLATNRSGLSSSCTLTVEVRDTTPPLVTATAVPSLLYPADGRMVDVHIDLGVQDACGAASAVLVSAVSSEPDDAPGGFDGATVNDIQDADLGAPDTQVLLRAERDRRKAGRVYTLTYQAVDERGNVSAGSAQAIVPRRTIVNRSASPSRSPR